jgi:tetratricopeptide (TPR) repeat protein
VFAAAASSGGFSQELFEELVGYGNMVPWPQSLGSHPDALYEWRLLLAKAYEDQNQWREAYKEYNEVFNEYDANPNEWEKNQEGLQRVHAVLVGYARCMFLAGKFDEALRASQHAVRMIRSAKGVHMLIAKTQRALARPPLFTAYSLRGMTNKTACSMADAVETVHRGVMYETPWDENNQRVNRVQELSNEMGDKGR